MERERLKKMLEDLRTTIQTRGDVSVAVSAVMLAELVDSLLKLREDAAVRAFQSLTRDPLADFFK